MQGLKIEVTDLGKIYVNKKTATLKFVNSDFTLLNGTAIFI